MARPRLWFDIGGEGVRSRSSYLTSIEICRYLAGSKPIVAKKQSLTEVTEDPFRSDEEEDAVVNGNQKYRRKDARMSSSRLATLHHRRTVRTLYTGGVVERHILAPHCAPCGSHRSQYLTYIGTK